MCDSFFACFILSRYFHLNMMSYLMRIILFIFFFVKQKTAYDVRISYWSSDLCSSDLLFLHRRPQEGHDPGVGIQRVSQRGRGRHRDDARRARGGCRRRTGREVRRGGQAGHRQEGSGADGRADQGARAREPHRLQEAALRGIPRRTAQEQRGQEPAPRTARRNTRQGRLTTASASGASRYGTAGQAGGPYPKLAPWGRKTRKMAMNGRFACGSSIFGA